MLFLLDNNILLNLFIFCKTLYLSVNKSSFIEGTTVCLLLISLPSPSVFGSFPFTYNLTNFFTSSSVILFSFALLSCLLTISSIFSNSFFIGLFPSIIPSSFLAFIFFLFSICVLNSLLLLSIFSFFSEFESESTSILPFGLIFSKKPESGSWKSLGFIETWISFISLLSKEARASTTSC